MTIHLTCEETGLLVSGKTFEVKETIKSLGGKWDAVRRIWTLPLELDTDEIRTRLGAMLQSKEVRMVTAAKACTVTAAAERHTKAVKKKEKQRAKAEAEHRKLVEWCLADTSGKYSWVCCEQCEIVDFKRGQTSCMAHAHWNGESWCSFRVFGSVYNGMCQS